MTSTFAARALQSIVGARTRAQASRALWGYALLTPWIIGLVLFIIGPMLASFYFAFTNYDIIKTPTWVGLDNYSRALTSDPLFWPSLGRTLKYSFAIVPLELVASLLLALLLNQNITGRAVYRTLFFLPSLTPTVATAILWTWLLHPQVGPVNTVLGWVGLPKPGWFADPKWALSSLILVSLWLSAGGSRMLIFLAGLQGVPEELHDASKMDGAGRWASFRHVTLPMISPTILFNFLLGVIGALKVFSMAYVATKGGPARATWFLALHIYSQAFQYYRMGYGAALAWLFAVVVIVFTVIQMKLSNRWVFYAGQ